jgi:LacI family transcriptional regulator, galactose operon repressor
MTDPIQLGNKNKATMTDVATLAGVSQATVSFVLNGSPGAKLSEATRSRVRQAADELGYRLPRRKVRKAAEAQPVIVFMVDEVASDPWMAIAFDGAQKRAAESGLSVFLTVTGDDTDSELAAIDGLDGKEIVGIIYGTILTRRVEVTEVMSKHRTVLLNCYDDKRSQHAVIPGELLAGRTATQHLIDAGRKRVGFINGQQGIDASRDRLKGYRQALSSNDIPFAPELVKSGNWEPSSGYELTKELLALPERPDAIFCANDPMAYGCFDALREAGLRIPNDISVVGFDDRELAKHMHPSLTTMLLPHFEMGEIATETLIEMAGGYNNKPSQIKVDCNLIPRKSV